MTELISWFIFKDFLCNLCSWTPLNSSPVHIFQVVLDSLSLAKVNNFQVILLSFRLCLFFLLHSTHPLFSTPKKDRVVKCICSVTVGIYFLLLVERSIWSCSPKASEYGSISSHINPSHNSTFFFLFIYSLLILFRYCVFPNSRWTQDLSFTRLYLPKVFAPVI